jgi:hypothetical protein
MGRAAARTVSRSVTAALENNGNTYDGQALFSAPHNNLLTTALDETQLQVAMTKMRTQTDPNGLRIGLRPQRLLIPVQLEYTARRILNSAQLLAVPGVAGTGVAAGAATTLQGNVNVAAGLVDYTVEDYLTDANNWYLIADPQEAPVIGVGFLNGRDTPDVFLKDPGMRNVLGGNDPYSMEFDEIVWKIRQDWGTGLMDWRGAVGAIVP